MVSAAFIQFYLVRIFNIERYASDTLVSPFANLLALAT